SFSGDHAARCEAHYAHAKAKHPYFCDALLPTQVPNPMLADDMHREIVANLRFMRERLKRGKELKNTLWNEILNCEVWEATEAIANNDPAAAVEELYDSVAVLLRTIDVLEGRQALGKPISGNDAEK
ncbi:MAG: hypothetical protein J6V72_02640, partial [Kiritimatiellae bacterium]|nr:hypothetical protein [Kiritimatiellia bacterium]